MSFPISLSSGCSELAPHNCPGSCGRNAWCGAGRSPKVLGNGSESVFWILTIKERTTKKQARWQLWLRLRIWETGTSMRDCMEGAGAAGHLWVQLRASLLDLGDGMGTRQGWLGSLPYAKTSQEKCGLHESGSWGKREQGRAGSAGLARSARQPCKGTEIWG